MVTITQTLMMTPDGMEALDEMATFYRMTVGELLTRAMLVGLEQAEHVMNENIAHAARIEAATKALAAPPEGTVQ